MKLNPLTGALIAGALAASSLALVEAQTSDPGSAAADDAQPAAVAAQGYGASSSSSSAGSVQVFTATQLQSSQTPGQGMTNPNGSAFTAVLGANQATFDLSVGFVFNNQFPPPNNVFPTQVVSVWIADAAGQPIVVLCGMPQQLVPPINGTFQPVPIPDTAFVNESGTPCDQAGTGPGPSGLFTIFQNAVTLANNATGAELGAALEGAHLVVNVIKNTGLNYTYDADIEMADSIKCEKPEKPEKKPPHKKPGKGDGKGDGKGGDGKPGDKSGY